ncbi:hypothetical protein FG386_001257 [Cryptosporidium ryanae]|uniref:uncharacterized protein n=1 Tax=Cryptosporidium ryanae TaxID=515981 RepID=UPI003519FB58|nr:hypothetical protein FG386_001257 [Cryptosporidium ryanae]
MDENNIGKQCKHVITIEFSSTENAKIVIDSLKPDFLTVHNSKVQANRQFEIVDSKLIVTVECSDLKTLRKTVNSIYGALILSTKTIEVFG